MLLRLVLGERAPLRGYEVDLAAYAKRTGAVYVPSSSAGLGVAVLPRGRVLFDYGVVSTPQRRLVADVSPQMGLPAPAHDALAVPRLPPMTRFLGRLAVLSSTGHQRYYHWMFDVLPRLELLQEAGLGIDAYLINTELGYQQDAVRHLSIAPVISPSSLTHIEADELVVPTLTGDIGYPTRDACDFLRKSFLPATLPSQRRRLYISRRDAKMRRVVNEADVIAALSPLGFETVELEGMAVAEQVMLFAAAEMVVGPHGAGFVNTVFCPSGSGILEFWDDDDFSPSYELLASLRDMHYRRLRCRSVSPVTHDLRVEVADMMELVRSLAQQIDDGRVAISSA
ncbi:MAG: glycosyltransferase family 61 protein [Reyranella sp.]|nr:glycosyltransferase family 61 protein [Reyranella sp.]